MKLGKAPARHDARTLQLAAYLPAASSLVPQTVDWTRFVARWPMMRNDELSCCTIATAGHMIQVWTGARASFTPTPKDASITLPDSAIESAYRAVSGWRPGRPDTDNGAVELDVLKFWRKKGIGRHKIAAFASIETQDREILREALFWFGGVYAGVSLPLSAQQQRVWEVPPGGARGAGEPGSWGGHAVPIVAADPRGLTVVTWGRLQRMSWAFWQTYGDEAYAVLSMDYLDGKRRAPNGLDLAALQKDLAAIGRAG